jgi:glycerol-3-phosphate acyltransferase PlsY
VAVFVVIRHRDNCRRLLNGTENRFVKTKKDEPAA